MDRLPKSEIEIRRISAPNLMYSVTSSDFKLNSSTDSPGVPEESPEKLRRKSADIALTFQMMNLM
jgi:hypothetical protein